MLFQLFFDGKTRQDGKTVPPDDKNTEKCQMFDKCEPWYWQFQNLQVLNHPFVPAQTNPTKVENELFSQTKWGRCDSSLKV